MSLASVPWLDRAFVVADEWRLTHYPAARRNGV